MTSQEEKERYDKAWRAGEKTFTFVKTFGIAKAIGNRYSIVTDIESNPQSPYYRKSFHRIGSATYARPDFALQKAEAFVKRLHTDFINFQGVAIHFEFVNMGEVTK